MGRFNYVPFFIVYSSVFCSSFLPFRFFRNCSSILRYWSSNQRERDSKKIVINNSMKINFA